MTTVSLKNLQKYFGPFEAVKSISLDVESGEFMVLLGPSGCGKTTTLRMIAGLEQASAGELIIGGRNVEHVPGKDRDIAMVFQSYALYPHKTVRQNLSFALKLRGMDPAVIVQKVNEVAQIIGIAHLLDQRPKTLSGGQQQRVALGRAMVRSPAVFLFDEPLSNLDAKLRNAMRHEIIRLHQSLKATMIYVTHDQVEAMTMADRIVVMNHGTIEQVGTPLEVYDDPHSEFVAAFIGMPAMNIIESELRQAGDGLVAVCGGLQVPGPRLRGSKTSGAFKLGIRPEFVRVHLDGGSGPKAKVSLIEHLGSETILYLETEGPELIVKAPRMQNVSVGDVISIEIDPSRVFAFDRETGQRIDEAGGPPKTGPLVPGERK